MTRKKPATFHAHGLATFVLLIWTAAVAAQTERTATGHVHAMAFAPNGSTLAVGTDDGVIRFYQ